MPISAPYSITECGRFFTEPGTARQRQYEALRAFYVDQRPSAECARSFGYSPGAFRVLLSPRRVVGVLRRHTSGSARATQEEPRPRTDHRATQAQLLGLRDQPSAQGAGNAAKRHCGARGSGRGGLCTLTAPARRGASRPDRPQCTSRCQCRGLRAQPARVHHPDRRVVPVRPTTSESTSHNSPGARSPWPKWHPRTRS